MRITDGKKTVDIRLAILEGTGYGPDWSLDFFDAGSLPYDEETETFTVEDVDYCIDQAIDWKNSTGDFSGDTPNENNTVIIDGAVSTDTDYDNISRTEKWTDFYGCTATITVRTDGLSNLCIRTYLGSIIHAKTYNTYRGARISMGKMSDCWRRDEKC